MRLFKRFSRSRSILRRWRSDWEWDFEFSTACFWRWLPIIIASLVFLDIYLSRETIFRELDYYYRPFWSNPPAMPSVQGPNKLITHFHWIEKPLHVDKYCSFHGWRARSTTEIPKVIDAIIFSNELDLLEIRLKELWEVVDIFVIVEADLTFTGWKKRLFFEENKQRFAWAEKKIRHFVMTSLAEKPYANRISNNEDNMRDFVTKMIKEVVKPEIGDLIFSMDADEIPYSHTVELVKNCKGYTEELHFQFQNFAYSFQFKMNSTTWRPHVTIFDSNFTYHHSIKKRRTTEMLMDSGWHCNFCYRYLSDFIFKLASYSSTTEESTVEPEDIQAKICVGGNIFELQPRAYLIKDLITGMAGKLKKEPSTATVPKYVMENFGRFQFLTPGGCVREDHTIDAPLPREDHHIRIFDLKY